LNRLLLPFSWVYGVILSGRNAAYAHDILPIHRLPVPVISVGNLTLGGSGKTPCVMFLAQESRKRGLKPVILTRGYKGKVRGVHIVSDGKTLLLGPEDAGDEAYLMARLLSGVPVVKCPDRIAGGLHAHDRFQNNLFILDDGFQHRRLDRDVNIVLIEAPSVLTSERLFPAGRLREPRTALHRADEIIFTWEGASGALAAEFDLPHDRPVSVMTYRPFLLVNRSRASLPIDDLQDKRVVAFCAIANPDRFRTTLETLSAAVIEFHTFRDHHIYSEREIRDVLRSAREAGADLVITTEKDLVKIQSDEVWALRMTAELPSETLDRIFAQAGVPAPGQEEYRQVY